jgi:putative ABC transport system permease protein
MIAVAGLSILRKAGIRRTPTVVAAVVVSLVPGILVPVAVLLVVVRPEPWYTASMVVPLVGMVLGNSLRGNIIALSQFRESLTRDRGRYAARLLAGASRREALTPVMRQALQASLAPQLASIATIGLVSLPGMMTGQILGGAPPLTAIRYQVAIMLTILAAVSLAAVVNLWVGSRLLVDDHDMPVL